MPNFDVQIPLHTLYPSCLNITKMDLKKKLAISYSKMASISIFAGLITLSIYNISLKIFGSSEKSLLLSSFIAYAAGVVVNFFLQALNGSYQPTARKMLFFFAVNLLNAALTSITSAYLISALNFNNDQILINLLYCSIIVAMSPFTFFLYKMVLRNKIIDTNKT